MSQPLVRAYAAAAAGAPFSAIEYDPGALADDEVEIAVDSCGVCHSDLSMLDNEWRASRYPLVPGHEIVGRVVALGPQAKRVALGDRVGLGWMCRSCMHCEDCMAGRHHHCAAVAHTIIGRHGGFGDRVRAHWAWVLPLPQGLDAGRAGPLFCGGITVFAPLAEFNVRPTDRVGVVGIGGLGHLALQFARAFGCEVTAFTSNEGKRDEARALGAHHVVATHDKSALKPLQRQFDFLLVTTNVALDWPSYFNLLAPRGRLHVVGAIADPIAVRVSNLMAARRSLSSSPVGSPATQLQMLAFCARHGIKAQTEHFPMSRVNDAFEHLRSGKARYRVVLDADFA